MLTAAQEKICDKYAHDKDGKCHCDKCPLNLTAELNGELACKGTHHYDRMLKMWVPDDGDENDGSK